MSSNPTSQTDITTTADEAAVRRAISSTSRPAKPSALSAALTFGWRGMLKVKHVPEQLLDVTITPVMFVLMFTYIFGGAVSGATGNYRDYLIPGILVMSVLFTTVYSGVRVAEFSLGQPSLDEVFLALTGHPADDGAADQARLSEEEQAT